MYKGRLPTEPVIAGLRSRGEGEGGSLNVGMLFDLACFLTWHAFCHALILATYVPTFSVAPASARCAVGCDTPSKSAAAVVVKPSSLHASHTATSRAVQRSASAARTSSRRSLFKNARSGPVKGRGVTSDACHLLSTTAGALTLRREFLWALT